MHVAALAASLLGSMPVGSDIVPRDLLGGDDLLFPRPQRPEASRGAFGNSYTKKGRSRPADSKLARKAARGKL